MNYHVVRRTMKNLFGNQPDAAPPEYLVHQQIEKVRAKQGAYQPFFGIETGGPRNQLLDRNCNFVIEHFKEVTAKKQVRVLDVGCNAGYVAMSLARDFMSAGIDVDEDCVSAASMLAGLSQSTAKFAVVDFLDIVESDDVDLEQIDVILLLNVVHQFIFARGPEYVKLFFKRLVQRVDVVFVELARRHEYNTHPSMMLLPEDPASILDDCDCEKTLLVDQGRPVYKLTRRALRPRGTRSLSYNRVSFSEHPDWKVSRKYYFGDRFIKVFRFNDEHLPLLYRRELWALLKLREGGFAPRVYDWGCDNSIGWIALERIYGRRLLDCLSEFVSADRRIDLITQILRIAKAVQSSGLYHNDFSAHNFVVSNGKVRLVDFEQAIDAPSYDHLAFFAWVIHDVWKREPDAYNKDIFKSLVTLNGPSKAPIEAYPSFDGIDMDPWTKSIVDDLFAAGSWQEFLAIDRDF